MVNINLHMRKIFLVLLNYRKAILVCGAPSNANATAPYFG
jgi:hypothetical protein